MIFFLSGVPRSGKTFNAVARWLIPSIKEKKYECIYTNITGYFDEDRSVFIYLELQTGIPAFDIEKMIRPLPDVPDEVNKTLMSMPRHSLAIVDEAQNIWGSRDFKTSANKDVMTYFTTHRKLEHDLLLITQNIEQVDISARRNAEGHYFLKRLKTVGFDKLIHVDYYDQAKTMECAVIGTQTWKFNKSIFKCYRSHNAKNAVEVKYKHTNIFLASKKLWIVAVAFLIGIITFIKRDSKDVFDTSKKAQNKQAETILLGQFEDYYCDRAGVILLRNNGTIDTIPPNRTPVNTCPYIGFEFRKNNAKGENENANK